MSDVHVFEEGNARALLMELARPEGARRLEIVIDGDEAELISHLSLGVSGGYLTSVEAGEVDPSRAIVRLALARSGRVTVVPSTDAADLEACPTLEQTMREAEDAALAIESQLAPVGGLTSAVDLGLAQRAFPEDQPSGYIARLFDGPVRLIEVLRASPYDELTTSELLRALADAGYVEHPESAPEHRTPTLDMRTHHAPDAPLIRGEGPIDEDELSAAGVSQNSWRVWITILVAVFVGLLTYAANRGGPPTIQPPPAEFMPPPPPPPPVATTTTASTASTAYSLANPPPIAGPEADQRLQDAELAIAKQRYREAGQVLADLRERLGHEPTVWVLSAHLEAELGHYKTADEYADKALSLDEQHFRAWVVKGSALQFQRKYRGALRAYEAALKIAPRHPMSADLNVIREQLADGQGGAK